MDDAPPQLILSALIWDGFPTSWIAGDDDKHVGTYTEEVSVRTEFRAIEYAPAAPARFNDLTEEGAIFGENIPPLLRIALPGRLPWPERFSSSNWVNRPLNGPPFKFYNINWEDGSWEPSALDVHSVRFTPDLPGQSAEDVEPIRTWGDPCTRLGWRGPWVTTLLEKQDARQPLGDRTEILWDSMGKWIPTGSGRQNINGILVYSTTIRVIELTDYDDDSPSRSISDYEVRATVLRVLVKGEGFVRLQRSV
ncbi:hypothetical protein B0H16DRAFT_1779373 [Mycena metata]|uniref:Uncharacterized protein n=1 Tax=Mycena metata TaxID=1033252 RepID=A0AAD7HU25_9AGAR|nr:hypothetical protein B0H16DRAFT_1779373 [Mycena metata]